MAKDYPPSQPTIGWGKVVSSPSGVQGRDPAKGFFCIFSLRNAFGSSWCGIFVTFFFTKMCSVPLL